MDLHALPTTNLERTNTVAMHSLNPATPHHTTLLTFSKPKNHITVEHPAPLNHCRVRSTENNGRAPAPLSPQNLAPLSPQSTCSICHRRGLTTVTAEHLLHCHRRAPAPRTQNYQSPLAVVAQSIASYLYHNSLSSVDVSPDLQPL
jgi:hypothetical protein